MDRRTGDEHGMYSSSTQYGTYSGPVSPETSPGPPPAASRRHATTDGPFGDVRLEEEAAQYGQQDVSPDDLDDRNPYAHTAGSDYIRNSSPDRQPANVATAAGRRVTFDDGTGPSPPPQGSNFRFELLEALESIHTRLGGPNSGPDGLSDWDEEALRAFAREKAAELLALSERPPPYHTAHGGDGGDGAGDGDGDGASSSVHENEKHGSDPWASKYRFDPPKREQGHTYRKGHNNSDPWAGQFRCVSIPDEAEDATVAKGWKLNILIITMCLSIAMVCLDGTIVSTATPTLASDWHAINDIGWYGTAYLLPIPTMQPLWGKLYPYLSTKYLFLAGLLLFEGGSVVCALANSSIMFIMGRVVAGCGSSMLAPGAMLITQDIVPKARRPLMAAISSVSSGLASCLGPLLGGLFTTKLTWRWGFFINIPLGVIVGLSIVFFYTPLPSKKHNGWMDVILSLDIPGCILLSGAVVALLVGLDLGAGSTWKSPTGFVLFGMAGALLLGLIFEQAMIPDSRALLPKSILKRRGIIVACFFSFFGSVGSITHVYYLPMFFQGVRGASAEQSGVDILPYIITQTIAGIGMALIVQFTGYFNPGMLVGSAIFSIGAGLIYTVGVSTSSAALTGYQILAAFGSGGSVLMAQGIAQQLLDFEEASIGLAMVFMIRMLGTAMTISVGSAIFNSKLLSDLISQGVPPAVATVVTANFMSRTGSVMQQFETQVAESVAYALQDVFIIPVVVGCLSFLVACLHDWHRLEKPARSTTSRGGASAH